MEVAVAHIVLYPCPFGGIGQRSPDSYLVTPGEGVDKGPTGAHEETCDEALGVEGAFDDGVMLEGFELKGKWIFVLSDMLTHLIPDGGSDPAHRGSLAPCSVDGDQDFACHVNCRWHENGCRAQGYQFPSDKIFARFS